jgi:hypothetical protein
MAENISNKLQLVSSAKPICAQAEGGGGREMNMKYLNLGRKVYHVGSKLKKVEKS